MGTAIYSMKFEHTNLFPVWPAEHWLDQEVEFTLHGKHFVGIVESAERHHLCNGIHDILTVEMLDGDSQIKIQAHRQKFRRTRCTDKADINGC